MARDCGLARSALIEQSMQSEAEIQNTAAAPVRAAKPDATHRYLYIDSMRGLLLAFMGLNHIPSDLQVFTDHIFGYVSSAEGFVFMSGLVAGLVYTRKRVREGSQELRRAAVARAGFIYRFHVVTFLGALLLIQGYGVVFGHPHPNLPPHLADPWKALLVGPLLLSQPPLLDILPMYCGFVLLIPAIVSACDHGARGRVIAASVGLWTLVNAFAPQTPLMTSWLNTGMFNICAWQLLFVTGAVFGHAWFRGERLLPNPRASILALLLAIAALLYAMRHAYLPSGLPRGTLDWLTNKTNFAPLRLFNTALIFYLVHVAVVRFPRIFSWPPFALLGRASIAVFAIHIPVAYAIQGFPQIFGATSHGRLLGSALMLATLFAAASVQAAWRARPATRLGFDSALATRN